MTDTDCRSVLIVTTTDGSEPTPWQCTVKRCRGQHSNGWVTWTSSHPMAAER